MDEPTTQYFLIFDGADPAFLTRIDLAVYQFNKENQEWIDAPWLVSYFFDSESPVEPVSAEGLEEAKAIKTLLPVQSDQVDEMSGLDSEA